MANFKHPETIGLHGGEYRSDPATTAMQFQFIKQHLTNLRMLRLQQIFGLKEFGNIYTRL